MVAVTDVNTTTGMTVMTGVPAIPVTSVTNPVIIVKEKTGTVTETA